MIRFLRRVNILAMAAEVGLEMGNSFPSDVCSVGVLLWEIYELESPFENVESEGMNSKRLSLGREHGPY